MHKLGLEPRPYQSRAITELYANWRQGHARQVLWLPTGAGKTVIALLIAYDCLFRARGGQWRILFVCDRIALIRQTVRAFQRLGVDIGYIWAGEPMRPEARIQVCSVQSMALPRYKDIWQAWMGQPQTLVVVDEVHELATRKALLPYEREPGSSWWLGLSATITGLQAPVGLADLYDALVVGPGYQELIDAAALVPTTYYSLQAERAIQTGGVTIKTTGEWDEGQLAEAASDPAVIDAAMDWRDKLTPGRRTVAFCVTVAHANAVMERAAARGWRSAIVTGSVSGVWRDGSLEAVDDETIYAWLESGRLEFVATVEKLTKGWDCPPVEVIMLLKPWRKARANYVQACGRGKRIAPGKSMSWVIDAGGNIERFGLLERQPHPELEHSRKSKGKQESLGLPTGKRCPGCGAVVALDCLLCQCGHEWPPLPPEELVKLQGFAGYRALSMEELEAVTTKTEAEVKRLAYVKLAVEAYRRGHKPGWAAVRYKDQFEVWPSWQVKRGAVFGRRPLPSDVYAYRAYLARFDKGEEWIDKQIRAEFGDAPPVEGEALSA